MATTPWIKSELDARNISYEEVHHENAYTAIELAERERFSWRMVAKVVVAYGDGRPVMLALPANRQVRLGALHDVLKAREVRLATERELAGLFSDCEVGAEPPLRHWPLIEIWMDMTLRTRGDILFHGGTHHDGIRMRFEDWYRLVRPRVAYFSA